MDVCSFDVHTVSECPTCGELLYVNEPYASEKIAKCYENHLQENEECKVNAENLPRAEDLMGILKDDPEGHGKVGGEEMKSKFAKLFEDDERSQILVMLKASDDEDEVELRAFAQPPGLGVCSVAIGFGSTEDDSSWDKAEEAFHSMDQGRASTLVQPLFDFVEADPTYGGG